MKKLLYILIILVILIGGFFWLNSYIYEEKQGEVVSVFVDYKDASYVIDKKVVSLVNGYAEEEIAPGSSSKMVINYFGNEVEGDLNNDGLSDIAFLLTQNNGGSGTFYYVAVALKGVEGYKGTNAILLGDRIAPQTTEIKNGVLIVNYAKRSDDEPMTASSSIGVSLYAIVNYENLEEIQPLFEGEQVLWGNVIMGHEVRSFTPCGINTEELWILGDSPAYKEILSSYEEWISGEDNPYAPLFVVLSGRITKAPTDGFGADYSFGFDAKQIVKIIPNGICI
jgi:hypothetical protein